MILSSIMITSGVYLLGISQLTEQAIKWALKIIFSVSILAQYELTNSKENKTCN